MNESCDICSNTKNPKHLLLETDSWVVILAPDQGYLGRSYVTLRGHKGHLSELTEQEWLEYAGIVKRLEKACTTALQATMFNWACLLNNAYQKEPANPHIHWHFRPRYAQEQEVAGATFTDPSFGHHYDREKREFPDDKILDEIAAKIKACI